MNFQLDFQERTYPAELFTIQQTLVIVLSYRAQQKQVGYDGITTAG